MLRALEEIRRMRGGAQGHLMRCDDGNYYVVKFQNNSQHRRVLVNELLGTRLAGRLGLPTVPAEIVEVSEELIRLTPELAMELPRADSLPARAAIWFPVSGGPRRVALHDLLPEEQLREVENLHDFCRDAGVRQMDLQHQRSPGNLFLRRPRRAGARRVALQGSHD